MTFDVVQALRNSALALFFYVHLNVLLNAAYAPGIASPGQTESSSTETEVLPMQMSAGNGPFAFGIGR